MNDAIAHGGGCSVHDVEAQQSRSSAGEGGQVKMPNREREPTALNNKLHQRCFLAPRCKRELLGRPLLNFCAKRPYSCLCPKDPSNVHQKSM
eukprot:3111082-Amphidinium_carterae.2